MSDLISRKDAIEAIRKSEFGWTWEGEQIINVVKELPSAQPEERTAKVKILEQSIAKEHDTDTAWCTGCGRILLDSTYKYCPHCGCRLEWDE